MKKYPRNEQELNSMPIALDLGSLLPPLNMRSDSRNSRDIWLYAEVYPDTMDKIIQDINDINLEDDIKEKEYLEDNQIYDRTRNPIKLYISSYGGSVYDGLGLIGTIKTSRTPVHTIAVGKVMSMGFLIAISGAKRFAKLYTSFMFHSLSDMAFGKFQELRESVQEDERLQKIIDNIVTSSTLIVQETLDDCHNRKLDWYFDEKKALELSVIDEII